MNSNKILKGFAGMVGLLAFIIAAGPILGDSNDGRFFLLDGSRAMQGALDMGGHAIKNLGGTFGFDSVTLDTADINGGTGDDFAVGSAVPSTGVFTNATATNLVVTNTFSAKNNLIGVDGDVFINQTSASTNGLRVNLPTGVEATASGVRIQGFSPALELMDKDGAQNWHLGVDDNNGNTAVIGRGYAPGQGVAPAVEIYTDDDIYFKGNVGIGDTNPTTDLSFGAAATVSTDAGSLTVDPASGSFINSGSGDRLIQANSTNNEARMYLNVASGIGVARVRWVEGSGNGDAANQQYELKYETGANKLALRSENVDGASTAGDILTVDDGTDDIELQGDLDFDSAATVATAAGDLTLNPAADVDIVRPTNVEDQLQLSDGSHADRTRHRFNTNNVQNVGTASTTLYDFTQTLGGLVIVTGWRNSGAAQKFVDLVLAGEGAGVAPVEISNIDADGTVADRVYEMGVAGILTMRMASGPEAYDVNFIVIESESPL